MNILVINPPPADGVRIVREGRCQQRQEAWGTSWAPLTLATIAAVLRDEGFNIKLKDCSNDRIDFEGLKKDIIDFGPALVIANTATPSIVSDLKVASLARQIDKNIKVIFFGIHVTSLPEEIFGLNPDVEYIASGEPEYTLRDFALALKGGISLKSVKGLVYWEAGRLIHNEARPFIENLDELPYPAWDIVDINRYRLPMRGRPFLLVLLERGCPYRCKFCAAGAFYGKKARSRSADRIISEIKYIQKAFNIHDFLFWSENATVDKELLYLLSIELARECPGIQWICNGRIDMVDEGLLNAMKAGGCRMIGYGIEAGTQRVLDLMHKDTKIEEIKRAVRLTRRTGIEVMAHIMIGYPGETERDALDTIRFVKKLGIDYLQAYCCVPFPGSELFQEAQAKGLVASYDWSKFEQNTSVLNTPQLTCEDTMRLRKKAIKNFYLDPIKMLHIISKVKSLKEFKHLFSLVTNYFSWIA